MPSPSLSPNFPLSTLHESMYATLAFFDIFDYPLTLEELQRSILGPSVMEQDLMALLQNEKKIEERGPYYFLKGKSHLVVMREETEKIAECFWRKVKRFVPLLQMIPFIEMVAVCNTLAFNHPTAESDIDLFIVAKQGRLYLARTLSTILFSLLGIRRHAQKIAGKFCLSFYISNFDLDLEKLQLPPQDLYLAFWIACLQPILGEKTYHELLEKNHHWLQTFFQHPLEPQLKHLTKNNWLSWIGKFFAWILKGKIGNFLEKRLTTYQQKRYSRALNQLGSQSSVVVNDHMLKFHNIDRRQEFLDKFIERYQTLVDEK